MTRIDDLPGAELITAGLRDVARGATGSPAALLVRIAAPRLSALGLPVPSFPPSTDAELLLYAELGREGRLDPYGDYNALLRRLSSFVHALEHRVARAAR